MLVPAGCDVAARSFDICVLFKNQVLRNHFENSREGLEECIKWLNSFDIKRLQLVLEPTGRYSDLIAQYFRMRRSRVLLAQPLMFRRYAESLDMRGKTDKKDAFALAKYSQERGETLHQWVPKTQIEAELRDMRVLIRGLTKRSSAIQSQLQCGLKSHYVKDKLEKELATIEKELDEAIDRSKFLIDQDPVLKQDLILVMTIKGIGIKSGVLLVTLIDFRSFRSSRALACFLGLTKKPYESGESVKGKERTSKRGSKLLRGALFMPARSARRSNPLIAEFAGRLVQKKKHDWAIQIAVIRKLVVTAWAIVTSGMPYDPGFKNPHLKPI
jgi:transposase